MQSSQYGAVYPTDFQPFRPNVQYSSSPHPTENVPLIYEPETPQSSLARRRCKRRGFLSYCLFGVCISLFLMSIILATSMVIYTVKCSKFGNEKTVVFSAYAKDASNFDITNHDGMITIFPAKHQTSNITITVLRKAGYKGYLGDFDAIFTTTGGNILFEERVTEENIWNWLGVCKRSEIWVELPSFSTVKPNIQTQQIDGELFFRDLEDYPLGTFLAQGSSGDITMSGVKGSLIQAQTFFGDIRVENITSSKISLTANHGDIQLTNGRITLSKMNDALPSMALSCGVGNVGLNGEGIYLETEGTIILKSSKGSIEATTQKFAGTFEISTIRGNTEVTGDGIHFTTNQENFKNGTVGEGNSSFLARTNKGDVGVSFS